MTYFTKPAPVWDEKKCQEETRRVYSILPSVEKVYNGGCVHDGEWYDGERNPLPVIPSGWEWHYVVSWGWHVRKRNEE